MANYTQEQYGVLCAAIAQGVTIVKYGDKEVTYRSLSEMLRIKSLMETDLNISKGSRKKYSQTSKGLQ